MKTIALITDRDTHDLTPDDRLLLPALRAHGFDVIASPWDSADIQWDSLDFCILRSCWDYHLRVNEFLRWLQHLEDINAHLLDPLPVVRWNYHKRYLKEFERQGIPIIPTYVVEGVAESSLPEIISACGWDDVVLKPCISASGHRTYRTNRLSAQSHQTEFEEMVKEGGGLIQPFINEVQLEGEWSFIFFNREFSHAVIKRPPAGEYKSQEHFGGVISKVRPYTTQVQEAVSVIDAVEGELFYARVDMIQVGGKMLLGELELIEPSLFLAHDPESPERFARALSQYMEHTTTIANSTKGIA